MSREIVVKLLVHDANEEEVSEVELLPFDSTQDRDLFSSYMAAFCMKIIEKYPNKTTVRDLKKDLSEMVLNPELH